MFFLMAVAFLSSIHANAISSCRADSRLESAGWVIHAANQFSSLEKQVMLPLTQEKQDFILDMSTKMMSYASGRPVQVDSFDRLSTTQSLMYGDILVVTDLKSGKLSELRWFDGSRKHVVYNGEFQKCAMEMIPYAENALF